MLKRLQINAYNDVWVKQTKTEVQRQTPRLPDDNQSVQSSKGRRKVKSLSSDVVPDRNVHTQR